jgi:hypothetical protein
MRVGILTGPSIAGSVGSPQRQEYTLLGDALLMTKPPEKKPGRVKAEGE